MLEQADDFGIVVAAFPAGGNITARINAPEVDPFKARS
jgi:hypothetical protein